MTPPVAEFLGRLTRLDPAALVRIRGAEMWARVPWNVLVTRTAGELSVDRTVSATAWLSGGGDPAALPSLDDRWRVGLPPPAAPVVETIPAGVLRRLAEAAAATLEETVSQGLNGRAVGSRMLRDALLDHVPIVVTTDDNQKEIRVPQRLVQAIARMGFLGDDEDPTEVRAAGAWIGICTAQGSAWWQASVAMSLRPHRA